MDIHLVITHCSRLFIMYKLLAQRYLQFLDEKTPNNGKIYNFN
jgi:hypothetical protein